MKFFIAVIDFAALFEKSANITAPQKRQTLPGFPTH